MQPARYTVFPLGDSALVVEFGPVMDEAVNRQVHTLFRQLQAHPFPGLRNLVPAISSLTVHYHIPELRRHASGGGAYEAAVRFVHEAAAEAQAADAPAPAPRNLRIPVCYEPPHAPDLDLLARRQGLSTNEVISLHSGRTYQVYMLGFLPGFAYMGQVDERIALPRRPQPRVRVEPGSIGIAGRQTGIYPLPSPGGWQLIGRTPLGLFDPAAARPTLFQPGDLVTFYPITAHEFDRH